MSYEQWPYLGVFAVLLACSFGLPLPEDVPLLTAGVLVHKELARLSLMIPVALVGVLAGDCVLFYIGRRLGHRVVKHRFFKRVVNPSRLLMAERLFQRHGIKIIFIGRFLPGLRPMIFMAAGVLQVPFKLFIGINGLAACVSVPVLVFLGKVFGNSYEQIEHDVRTASHAIVIVVIVALLVTAGVALHRRQKRLMAATGVQPELTAEALVNAPEPRPAPPHPQAGTPPESAKPTAEPE